MTNNSKLLGNFAEDIYSVESFEERFKIYEKHINILGFDGATYTFLPKFYTEASSLTPPIFEKTELFPIDFINHYSESRLDKCDFTIRKGKDKYSLPMDWREYEISNKIYEKERNLILLAREEYNVKNAITIPTMYSNLGMSGVSIISSEKDRSFKILKNEKLKILTIMSKQFNDINFSNSRIPSKLILPLLGELTHTQILILHHLASGKQLKNINDSTHLSYKYASNELGRLRKKLGGITRDQLMYLFGLINSM